MYRVVCNPFRVGSRLGAVPGGGVVLAIGYFLAARQAEPHTGVSSKCETWVTGTLRFARIPSVDGLGNAVVSDIAWRLLGLKSCARARARQHPAWQNMENVEQWCRPFVVWPSPRTAF